MKPLHLVLILVVGVSLALLVWGWWGKQQLNTNVQTLEQETNQFDQDMQLSPLEENSPGTDADSLEGDLETMQLEVETYQ